MKQAIVVTSFGVHEKTVKKKCIDTVIADIRREYSDYDIYEAWTSEFLIKKLYGEGIRYWTLADVLAMLEKEGYEKVVILPTHLTMGEEFNKKILSVSAKVQDKFHELLVAEPVLTGNGPKDYEGTVEILADLNSLTSGENLVFMGHGTPNVHNTAYELMQQYADDKKLPIHIGVMKDELHPNLLDIKNRLRYKGVKKVFLRPLLLAGGEHVNREMAGNAPDSWKNEIKSLGIEVRCSLKGLGEYPKYRTLYTKKLKDVIYPAAH